ncbi:MAG: response regulator transcription factor [Rhodoferax sp.]|jgi:DNA-binding NarL/FixJ family response regulator|nr:response regulator transcription factor [Rhodoferax sp.]
MLQSMTPPRIRVHIHHQDPLIRVGLHAALATQPEFDVTAEGPVPRSGASPGHGTIDVLVTDHAHAIHLLHSASDGLHAAVRPPGNATRMRILVVTSLTGEHQIRQAVMAGVAGYVVQGGTLDTYVDAVRALGQGMRYVCRRASQELMESVSQATLTTREREVLCPLVRGLANKAIARELGISVGTVKVHVRAILDKLQASSRTQAASVAVQRGLIEAAAGQPEAHRGARQVAVSLRETRPPMPRNRPAHAHSAHAA